MAGEIGQNMANSACKHDDSFASGCRFTSCFCVLCCITSCSPSAKLLTIEQIYQILLLLSANLQMRKLARQNATRSCLRQLVGALFVTLQSNQLLCSTILVCVVVIKHEPKARSAKVSQAGDKRGKPRDRWSWDDVSTKLLVKKCIVFHDVFYQLRLIVIVFCAPGHHYNIYEVKKGRENAWRKIAADIGTEFQNVTDSPLCGMAPSWDTCRDKMKALCEQNLHLLEPGAPSTGGGCSFWDHDEAVKEEFVEVLKKFQDELLEKK